MQLYDHIATARKFAGTTQTLNESIINTEEAGKTAFALALAKRLLKAKQPVEELKSLGAMPIAN